MKTRFVCNSVSPNEVKDFINNLILEDGERIEKWEIISYWVSGAKTDLILVVIQIVQEN